ncbi:MAG: LysM peptidoglycan-binding domain-containing protein [Granulosicoccus sp.]
MSISNHAVFRTSLLAIAIFSLSACSTAPRMPDYDIGQIGDGIANAGKSTADFGRKALSKTAYLLGFTDEDPRRSDDPHRADETLLEEVDVALLDNGRVEYVEQGSPTRSDMRRADLERLPADWSGDTRSTSEIRSEASIISLSANAEPAKDLIHKVAVNENLWSIAKSTTGDATNWHVLADVNNLEPNASVYPGQELVIPASMLKTDEAGTADKRLPLPEVVDQTDDLRMPELPVNATAFTLDENETLWDLAKRTTGDALNWQAIANANNFSENDAVVVFPGQTIYVPDELVSTQTSRLPEDSEQQKPLTTDAPVTPVLPDSSTVKIEAVVEATPAERLPTENRQADASVGISSIPRTPASEQTAADIASTMISENGSSVQEAPVSTSALSLLDETQPLVIPPTAGDGNENIKIVEASYQAEEATASEPVKQLMPQAAPVLDDAPREIMVSGTYYPKAVYNEADFSSSLLMRVSPGTRLQVSQAMGTWFKVQTDKGTGYVHQRDIK